MLPQGGSITCAYMPTSRLATAVLCIYSGGSSSVNSSVTTVGPITSSTIPDKSGAAVDKSVRDVLNAFILFVTCSFVPDIVGTVIPRPAPAPKPPSVVKGFGKLDPPGVSGLSIQSVSLFAPVPEVVFPLGHAVHVVAPAAEYFPLGHSVHLEAPAAAYFPAGHLVQYPPAMEV